jgi:hypothetical protein
VNVRLLGKRVKAGLDKGRAIRLAEQKAQAEKNMAMVFRLLKLEQEQGRPRRGMAGRIARAMGHTLTDRRIRQIISELSEPFFRVSDSGRYAPSHERKVAHAQ